jgi:hypothetical protein
LLEEGGSFGGGQFWDSDEVSEDSEDFFKVKYFFFTDFLNYLSFGDGFSFDFDSSETLRKRLFGVDGFLFLAGHHWRSHFRLSFSFFKNSEQHREQ